MRHDPREALQLPAASDFTCAGAALAAPPAETLFGQIMRHNALASIPYCREVLLWNKHKVKRLLENPRYTGKEGYPILVEADIFQAAQEKTA